MTKDNIFQTITLILGAGAFVVIGMVISAFVSQKIDNTQVKNNSETQQIIDFLSLAENNTRESGLYGEANLQSLEFNLHKLEDSLSQTIQTQEDANLYMIYWGATAIKSCVHSNEQNELTVTAHSVDACMKNIKNNIQASVAQMSDSEQKELLKSAESWNVLSSVVEYYNLFMQNNFVQTIQNSNQLTSVEQPINELDI